MIPNYVQNINALGIVSNTFIMPWARLEWSELLAWSVLASLVPNWSENMKSSTRISTQT